jgi:hypothetical protein
MTLCAATDIEPVTVVSPTMKISACWKMNAWIAPSVLSARALD